MLCDFVLALYKLLVKTKKIVLEQICFHRDFEFLKNISFIKKKMEHQLYFRNFRFGISIVLLLGR